MRRSLPFLAVAALCVVGYPARADEPPDVQLEFVRKLRAKRYSNLALEYLEKFQKKAPPALAPLVSLEIARTRISLGQEKEPEQRAPVFAQARRDLQAFLKAHANRPEAAEARVELARLAALEGKAQLSVALRQETRESQVAGALKARQQFLAAGKELQAAAQQLEALQAKYAEPKTDADRLLKDKLGEAHLQVLLDRGTNYLDQAETYIDEAKDQTIRERAQVIEEATKVLLQVAGLDAKSVQGTLARAWLVRCYQLTDAPQEASKQYKRVLSETGARAQAGKRLAWYFHIQGIPRDPSVKKDKNKEIEKEAGAWLKTYAAYRNTPEGQGVRFELAKARMAEAQALGKGAAATKLYNLAQKEFAVLASSDSDLAPKANELNLTISFIKMGKDTPVDKLKDFEECYLKARYEMSLLQQSAGKPGKADGPDHPKAEEERKAHLKTILAALQRGLRLADAKTDTHKLGEARYYLTFAYLLAGDPYRAAVMGESLARSNPATSRTAAAAGYAVEAYAALLNGANGNTEDTRSRLRDLATYILKDKGKVWQNEPVTGLARYQLAMVDLREKQYAAAIGLLEQLPSDFNGYVYAQSQLALTAVAAAKEAKTDAERLAYQDRALRALRRIPTLPAHADPATAQMFFAAQLEQGNLLYAAAVSSLQQNDSKKADQQFAEMEKFTMQLLGQFHKMDTKLSPQIRDRLGSALNSLQQLARYGLANTEYRAGHYDKVLALTGDAVKAVKAQAKGDGPITLKDYKVTGGLLALDLRAKVQTGKVSQAKDLLPLLRRLRGENELENDTAAVLRSLVQDLRVQVKALKEKGDEAQLKTTVEHFSAFLEELARQADPKGMQRDIFFLASCYSSLGKHDKAAALYGQIPEPQRAEGMKPEEREIATYWFMQLQRARELRLAKEFPEARAVLAKIPPRYRSLTVEQEDIYQLEDQHIYGTALTRWNALLDNRTLLRKSATDNEAKKLYFDCYYHFVLCCFEYGKNHKVPAKQTEFIRRAADNIVRLETAANQEGWQLIGTRLQQLVQVEPLLRAQYDQLKKTNRK